MAYDLSMAEKYRHYYVSQALVRAWSEDGKKASWCNPIRDKSIPAGGIERYFHSAYIDEDGRVRANLDAFDIMFSRIVPALKAGDFSSLTDTEHQVCLRELLLMQIYQSPSIRGCFEGLKERLESLSDAPIFNGITATKERNEYYQKKRNRELFDAINKSITFGVYLIDLTPCLLRAPEGKSFLLGASSVSVLNPYVRMKDNPLLESDRIAFMDRGTVLVLPLTPSLSFCLYDGDIYSLPVSDGVCTISESDADILNRIQIYNTGMAEGVLYTGEEKYVRSLVGRKGSGSSIRSGFPGDDLDRYPFSTLLSVMDMKENREADDEDPRRELGINMRDYDDENFPKIKGDQFWPELEKRNRYALRVLRYLRKQKK
jgi:hypothetical protein